MVLLRLFSPNSRFRHLAARMKRTEIRANVAAVAGALQILGILIVAAGVAIVAVWAGLVALGAGLVLLGVAVERGHGT